jgi:hypothetical protein
MDQSDTYRKTLTYALTVAGGEPALALRLNVSVERLRSWLGGSERIPDAAFLQAVDVIVAANQADIARLATSTYAPRTSSTT